jgi:small-conductance mechanosensitive channel
LRRGASEGDVDAQASTDSRGTHANLGAAGRVLPTALAEHPMAQVQPLNEVQSLIASIATDLREVTVIWQLAAIALALAIAWGINRWLRTHLTGVEGRWRIGAAGLQRALFPLSALIVLLVAKGAMAGWNPVSLLRLAAALLIAMAIVRVVVYLLHSIFNQSPMLATWERLIATVVWTGLALHLTGLLPEIASVLDSVSFPVGKHQVSLLLLLRGAVSVVLTLLVALWAGRMVENRLMGTDGLDINVRVMFAKLAKAGLILVALLFALSVVGIDLTLLSVFGGALGVGLAFGLQKIASNYVSGFIILADRSLSIGDSVVIDNREGTVTSMTARYIVVRNMDGTDALIPNETAITNTVINKSYSEHRARVSLPMQIAYTTDLESTLALIESVARTNPSVMATPVPRALVIRFAESGIDLELWVWIDDPEAGPATLRSDLYRALWRAFGEHGIEIPRPQRVVHLTTPADARPSQ